MIVNDLTPISIHQLENSRCAHAAANAHRHHSVSSVASLQFAQDRCGQLCSRAAERMTEGNRAAIDVDLIRVKLEHLDYGERLRGESFVQFDQIDLIECQTCKFQCLRNREDWSNPHF